MRAHFQNPRTLATDNNGVVVLATILIVAAVTIGTVLTVRGTPASTSIAAIPGNARHTKAVHVVLPERPLSYLGVYEPDAPGSYTGNERLAQAAGRQPNVALYYSGWWVPFQTAFAEAAHVHGAIPFVQLDPGGIAMSAIASGKYDAYLTAYAAAVAAYGHGVMIGFGHEMNGYWYSWGYRHTSPAAFVAAWRRIVNVFRAAGAVNVTWLWTVNIIDTRPGRIPAPSAWWPGSSYVTWVGIDGYYFKPTWTFASLFGPTIKAVRALTLDPILIAETGAAPGAGKPAKIADLLAGTRAYGLLGFVWFDANRVRDWRLNSPAALAAFGRAAKTFDLHAS